MGVADGLKAAGSMTERDKGVNEGGGDGAVIDVEEGVIILSVVESLSEHSIVRRCWHVLIKSSTFAS